MTTPASNTGDALGDTYSGIENVTGGTVADNITGDGNANTLSGLAGNDTLNGGAGDDILIGGAGADALTGGAGIDTASYTTAAAAVVANLATPASNTGDALGDTYNTIENLTGGGFNDTLTGDANANALDGGAGNDILISGAGADTLIGGAGSDTLTGGAGNDLFRFLAPSDAGDMIVDLNNTTEADKISIVKAGFGMNSGVALGTGDANDFALHYFVSGAAANNTAPGTTESGHGQFLFNTTSHQLFWDDDGSGTHAATLLATLQNAATLHAIDFELK